MSYDLLVTSSDVHSIEDAFEDAHTHASDRASLEHFADWVDGHQLELGLAGSCERIGSHALLLNFSLDTIDCLEQVGAEARATRLRVFDLQTREELHL